MGIWVIGDVFEIDICTQSDVALRHSSYVRRTLICLCIGDIKKQDVLVVMLVDNVFKHALLCIKTHDTYISYIRLCYD